MSDAAIRREPIFDALKGFAILWIVMFHIPNFEHCAIVRTYYAVPMFFVVSGLFFLTAPFVGWVKNRARRILLPMAFFYILAYIVYLVGWLIFERGSAGWGAAKELLALFNIHNPNPLAPLSLNYPLWFLLVLFNINVIYFLVVRLAHRNMVSVFVICGGLYLLGMWGQQNGVNGALFACQSLQYLLYFAFGNMVLPKIFAYIKSQNYRFIVLAISLVALVVLTIAGQYMSYYIIFMCRAISFMCLLLVLLSLIPEKLALFKLLTYFGRNSLIVFGVHTLIIWGILSFGLPMLGYGYGLFLWVLTVGLSYICILLINRFCPFLTGRLSRP